MVCFWQATKFIFAAFARQRKQVIWIFAGHKNCCKLYTLKWQASKEYSLSPCPPRSHLAPFDKRYKYDRCDFSTFDKHFDLSHPKKPDVSLTDRGMYSACSAVGATALYPKNSYISTEKKSYLGIPFAHVTIWKYSYQWIIQCSNVSTTPLRQWGFRQCLPFSWTNIAGTPLP